ncbi:MAG: DUF4349 domain-containing protein [Myxococcales bacterium]|nr:DUF4349 domain-containing protein [Myxococcales bacterium]
MLGLLLLGAPGCAKMAPASEAPYEEAYGGYDAGVSASAMDMDMSMDMEMEMAPMSDVRADRMSRRERRVSKRAEATGGAAPGSAPAEPAPAVSNGSGEPEPAATDDAPDHGRYIIYTATMQLSVFNLEDAMTRAESLPNKYGGYVQNMSSNYFIMRIPSEQLRPAMEELASLGVVDNRTLDASDVTEEYLDIETRIAVLEATQKQMMELLTKARTVEEALKVRQALDEITMELEVLKGRLRRLASLVSFSTLTLSLVERGPHTPTPSSNDPFPWVDELGVEATEWK